LLRGHRPMLIDFGHRTRAGSSRALPGMRIANP
jgi:hypothetical protein